MLRRIAVMLVLAGCAHPPLEPRPFYPQTSFDEVMAPWIPLGEGAVLAQDGCRDGGCVYKRGAGGVETPFMPYRGEHLRVSWWMRTEGVVAGPEPWHRATAQILWYDAAGKEIDQRVLGHALGTTDWKRWAVDVHPRDKLDAAYVRLRLMLWEASGAVWFDQPQIEVLAPPPEDPRIPPLAEVEDTPPIRWPMPPLQPLRASMDTGVLALSFTEDGGVVARRGASEVHVAGPRWSGALRAGTSVDRGFMLRVAAEARVEGELAGESYIEVFRGSPIVSIFRRAWRTGMDDFAGHVLELTGPIERAIGFDGDVAVRGSAAGAFRLDPRTATKPFLVLHDEADTRGVILFFPHPAERRRWYIEDYLVEHRPPVELEVTPRDGGARVRIGARYEGSAAPGLRSLDLTVFVLLYEGTAAEGLAAMRIGGRDVLDPEPPFAGVAGGYWTPRVPPTGDAALRMARYFPTELSSWIDGADPSLTYCRRGGYAWGAMTTTQQSIWTDPLSTQPLARDRAMRMLVFFLEAGREKGAPPNLSMIRSWASKLPDPNDIRTMVFSYYWGQRLPEMRRLMTSPHVQPPEAQQIARELQRARVVFDPDSPGTWTSTTPGGGLWFDYVDIPIHEGNQWIINTHAASVGNAGELAAIAAEAGLVEESAFWRRMFEGGVAGLLYAAAQPWMWDADDPDELLYARHGGGPRSYHVHMAGGFVPRILRQARAFAPDHVAELVAFERRLLRAKMLRSHPKAIELGEAAIAEVEQR